MTTQLNRYRSLVEALGQLKEREALQGAQTCLRHLCGQAQNPLHPEGAADGSIGPVTWTQLRDLKDALGEYLRQLDNALEATRKASP